MRWLLLTICSTTFTALAYVLAPLLPLCVQPDGHLPRWLSWFDTPDNLTIGDAQFQSEQMHWTQSTYLYALFWLWRNPAYGLDAALGVRIPHIWTYQSQGDARVTNTPLHEGVVYRTVTINGVRYWQFYLVRKWCSLYCLRINLGWKLWGRLEVGQVRSLVFSVTPFAKFT